MTKEEVIKIAVKAAIDHLEQQKVKQIKSRRDKRLRNTKLLLENYQLLKDHCDNAVYDKKTILIAENENIIDILDSLKEFDREDYIVSIKNSVSRTKVILSHIDEMIKIYRIYCEESDRPEDLRRYRVMRLKYFNNMKPAAICEAEGIDQSTYYRDSREIIEKLSALIFGIDGLSDMRKR